MVALSEESAVRRAFSGRTVLVTGGTGFLGMLITEKILRSVPDIKKLYLLTRRKKGMEAAKRINKLLDNEIFHIVERRTPDFRRRVCAVEGDVSEVGLGLSQEDRRLLTEEVEFIFNSAATVKFGDTLKRAVTINVRGAREMVLLAKSCRNLQAFVHISTAFCNSPYAQIVEEKFYKNHIDPEDLIRIVESIDDATAEKITQGLMDPFPNTYSFTKNAAENLILQQASDLPVAIIRPSLVLNCDKEPLPGWANSVYGLGGVFVALALGIAHVTFGYDDIITDMVPADYVINTCIAGACKTATANETENGKNMIANGNKMATNGNKMAADDNKMARNIYTIGSSWRNPVSWSTTRNAMFKNLDAYPVPYAVAYNWLIVTKSKRVETIANFFLMLIPAFIVDSILRVKGGKPMYVELYRKVQKFGTTIENWMSHEWRFKDDNTLALFHSMSAADQAEFNCDVSTWDMVAFAERYVLGSRRYILKESDDTIPAGKRMRRVLAAIHYTICSFLFCATLCVLYWLYSTVCVGSTYV